MGVRVHLLTQYFPPEVYPQTLWLAEALRELGFRVAVTTSIPNYPSGTVVDGYSAATPVQETIDGFDVLRAPVYPSHDHRALGRIANYASFAMSSTWFGRSAARTADVTLVWATSATAALAALVSRWTVGTPYVLYVQDLWPDSVFATQFLSSPAARKATNAALVPYLKVLYRSASGVVAISPGMRDALVSRGVPADRVAVAHNWVDERVIHPVKPDLRLRNALGIPATAFVMVFAGNLGAGQALHAWIAAMDRLREEPDIHLVFIGAGSQRDQLRRDAGTLGLRTVHFHDQVPVDTVSAYVADADVSVISLAEQPLFHITMPSKTAAALAQGRAVICSAPGETSETVRRAGAGWSARPEDADSIAAAILAARDAGPAERQARGQSGRDFYLEHMSKKVGARKIGEVLTLAAAGGKRRSLHG